MRISDWSSDVCSSDLRLQLTGEDVRLRIAGRALRVLEVVLGISNANQMRRIERIAAEARIDGRIDHILSRCDSGDRRKRDRKSVVKGKSVSVRVDIGGSRLIKKKTQNKNYILI